MIDLHMHFDGSLPVKTVLRLAREQKLLLPANTEEELTPYLKAPADCQDLNEYLLRFDLPLAVLQTEDALESGARELGQELRDQGIVYAEMRFAPQFHTKKGMTQQEVVQAVLKGLRDCAPGIWMNLILCCMRGSENEAENMETIRIAEEEIKSARARMAAGESGIPRVVAVDLAGAEAIFPTRDFSKFFVAAREKNIPYTIHAGEADGPESIRAALAMGAYRIGHGVRCVDDDSLVEELKEMQIPLECCLTSNLQTRAFASAEEHPLLPLYRRGLAVTVNTDNMTVSQTTIEQEFEILEKLGMTEGEKKGLLENSIGASFLSDEEKKLLRQRILK